MHENNDKNEIDWLEGNIPVSTRFDDPYFSKSNGLEETRHVFIHGNNLTSRWRQCELFSIGELGFGTGLNFLTTLLEWEKVAQKYQKLHFISYEKYPMSASQMAKALKPWSALTSTAEQLSRAWEQEMTKACKVLEIQWSDTVSLTVNLGDANDLLAAQSSRIDAWYLDGFSPAKNPELWNLELMQSVYEKTKENGTFATYTSAGWVRRNLMEAGFTVERVKGHAGKRQMSIGKRQNSN